MRQRLLIGLLMIIILSFSGSLFAQTIQFPKNIKETVEAIYQQYKPLNEGKVANYIPELAKVDPDYLAIVVVTIQGDMVARGDVNQAFAIESVVKPFMYALALKDHGQTWLTEKVGLNATGHRFNSILAIEENETHLQNPLVNAGAIQVASYIQGKNAQEKWQRILALLQQASDGKPYLSEKIYQSEMATNQRNRAIAELLKNYNMIQADPLEAVDRYTKACSVMVTAKQLALMGATLANHGVNPLTQQKIFSEQQIQGVLAQMITNGLYENSGTWFTLVGLPAKSGVSGAILAVVPNKMAIVVYSPRLDQAGNSVRAQKIIQELAKRWHLHLLGK